MIINEEPFRSNCFFQALKHKLKDKENIEFKAIFYWHNFTPHIHFYWQDNLYEYHFASYRKCNCKPIFKGNIHKHAKGTIKKIYKKSRKKK